MMQDDLFGKERQNDSLIFVINTKNIYQSLSLSYIHMISYSLSTVYSMKCNLGADFGVEWSQILVWKILLYFSS